MDLLVDLLGIVSLTGLVLTGVLGGGLGAVMGLLLIAGMVDGPRGGRLSERLQQVDRPEASDPTDPSRPSA